MKLFIKFLVEPTNILDNWYEAITEQVKNLIEDFRSTDMTPLDPFTWDEEQPILVMEQEDTRARFIRSPKYEGRFFLIDPMFILRYEWEQQELDEYCCNYEKEPIVIPPGERDEDYIFLCSFNPYAENINLDFSRIPRDSDCEENDEHCFCILIESDTEQ